MYSTLKSDFLFLIMYSAEPAQLDMQEAGNHVMMKITEFHHYLLSNISFIVTVVGYVLLVGAVHFEGGEVGESRIRYSVKQVLETSYATLLEIVWTIVPSILLIFLATPTFLGLYAFEKGYGLDTHSTFKIMGNQWYWDYEYSDSYDIEEELDTVIPLLGSPEYTSYMVATDDLELGELRLLEADTALYVPIEKRVRFIITSSDVIHCFAVPSLGLKLDAVPGRLNQLSCVIKRTGSYYGQCSEICGVDHGFMPINLIGY